jgi:signal transduction histidine kinase
MCDDTDHKVAEERLLTAIAAAARAQAAAEEAVRAKDEFIAMVSHELRTPLNTIRMWARMLRNENLAAKERAEGIGMVERAAIAQQKIIDDLCRDSRLASRSGSGLQGMDILVVEDDAATGQVLQRMLEGNQARVRVVDSVEAARDANADQLIAIILKTVR